MLEPVSLHQNRFNAPGIAPDARGVVLGKEGAVLFRTIDSLVGWFRILSDEIPLDDLLPSLRIHEVRSTLDSLAFLASFNAESSYLLDRAARLAALLGGLAFTGTGKHLVKYRDPRSPLGYDVDALSSEPGDHVLYGDGFVQAWRRVREIRFSELVFRLSPRRVPGGDRGELHSLWLAVAPGLARAVLLYLHRHQVAVGAAMVEREGGRSAFGAARGAFPARYLLARVTDLPERMVDLFESVPGIALFRPAADNVGVEVGYRHPLRLESCRGVFGRDRFYLFSGRRDAVDVIAGPMEGGALALVDGERLIAVGFDLGGDRPVPPPAQVGEVAPFGVALRLVPSTAPPRRVGAALLGWEQAAALKRLVFLLPPTMLAGCRVAPIPEGLLVVGSGGIDAVPLGQPYYEAAPSIFLPLGLELLPRVPPAILTERVGGVEGRKVVFRRGAERPIAVADSAFEPLARRVVGRIEVAERTRSERAGEPRPIARPAATPAVPAVAPVVVNDPIGPTWSTGPTGLFPLWGYRGPNDVDDGGGGG